MKFDNIGNHLRFTLPMVGALTVLINSESHAGTMGPVAVGAPAKMYASVFGGGGKSTRVDVAQYGAAFFREPPLSIGPLDVNIFGELDRRSVGLVGGHLGYQWSEFLLSPLSWVSGVAPGIELEGYYLGRSSFEAPDVTNETVILPEHDFDITLPVKAGVFLTNAVANFNLTNYNCWHPYVAAGIGAAVLSVKHATAFQVDPPEVGVNHFDGHPDDSESTFAAQIKAGLNHDFTDHLSIFLEYRWLYLSSMQFTFGSTVALDHPPTSTWLVKLDPQYYNMGALGLRYSI